ncbi:MAG: NADP-dependent oxidoreductase [Rhodanobacteraceae bacterium]
MTATNRQWQLISRPHGHASVDNFRLVETPLQPLADGQLRVRNQYLSLDPYMRGRMNDTRSYTAPQLLGAAMQGGTAGEVVESRNPKFKTGDRVVGMLGWQLYATSDGEGLTRVDNDAVPLSTWLGCVGMPGVTAWYGLNRIIRPKAGETVVVAAASGAVGSVVGQLARRHGARAVGIAGGPEKCKVVTGEFGFDACVDHKAGRLVDDLAAATPVRIDGDFENVGGPVLDAVLARMNAFGRIAVCGLIADYDSEPTPLRNFASVLINRLHVQGFIITEHTEIWHEATTELAALVASGDLHYRESISDGIESAPQAFLGLLKGGNFGKQLVKLF